MTSQQIQDALTLLPADLIAETDRKRTQKPKVILWKKYMALAACLALVLWGTGCYLMIFGTSGGASKSVPLEVPAAEEPLMQESHFSGDKSSPAEAAPKAPESDSANDTCGLPLAPTEAANSTAARTEATAPAEESLCIDHSHIPAEPEEETGFGGWCGNMTATVSLDGSTYRFSGSPAVTLTDILYRLDYTEEICRCAPEFTADTEIGTGYEINLTEYFVRFDGKQAALTPEQTEKIATILEELQ